jgi:sugar lactone lactonase YvrE
MFSVGKRIGGILATQGELAAKAIENWPLGRNMVVRHDGSLYVTGASGGALAAQLFCISPQGEKKPVDHNLGLSYPTGLALSPDQSLLYVADGHSHWIYSFQIAADGSLLNGQRFHCLHVPEWADHADVGGLAVDASGRLYVATNMGVQICDQAGRVNAILPLPSGQPTDICFGGDDFRTLLVTCGDRVFSRKLKVAGAPAFTEPIKPSPPRL